MKRKESGFTMMEMLIVLGILMLMVGLLIPALTTVKNIAKETKQKAQFHSIEAALTTFKNDYGDYPPSNGWYYNPNPGSRGGWLNYCGAQKLAEALLGWDLLGFHPRSVWTADGTPVYLNTNQNLEQRRGLYLELATANVFRLGNSIQNGIEKMGLFGGMTSLAPQFVLCDVFGHKKMTLATGNATVSQRAGAPILYYKANISSKSLQETTGHQGDGIYDFRDNFQLLALRSLVDHDKAFAYRRTHKLENSAFFYEYIRDAKVTARPWPYRPGSYLLISAGADGLYGTPDDIRNFGN